jgi:ribosomal protein S18
MFPVDWPEPFGLVMIEAMACGTPVLAFRCGSIPEVIEDGITGKVVDSEEDALAALPEILSYNRRAVRKRFEERFTATRMAKDYVSVYRRLLKTHTSGVNCTKATLMAATVQLPCRSKNRFRSYSRLAQIQRFPSGNHHLAITISEIDYARPRQLRDTTPSNHGRMRDRRTNALSQTLQDLSRAPSCRDYHSSIARCSRVLRSFAQAFEIHVLRRSRSCAPPIRYIRLLWRDIAQR